MLPLVLARVRFSQTRDGGCVLRRFNAYYLPYEFRLSMVVPNISLNMSNTILMMKEDLLTFR